MPAVRLLLLALVFILSGSPLVGLPEAAAQRFWQRFVPVKRVGADPQQDYSLTQQNGPWCVMAATFSGYGAEQQARELVMEFRGRYNLPAYLHEMTFRLDEGRVGRGVDRFGDPVRMKHQKGDALREWAVLVGDFRSLDDHDAQKLLKTVKTLTPKALEPDADGATAQSLGQVRSWQTQNVVDLGKKKLGPMRTAFLTRNPILPQEYFTPKGVDKTVEEWNEDFEHSLLTNQGKYTVRVATFTGKTILQGAKNAPSADSLGRRRGGLEEAGVMAHALCQEMRRLRIEAYEFHDRHQSIVTVGSFDRATLRGAGGRAEPVPQIAAVIQRFGAAFNTPVMPLQREQLSPEVQALVEREKQTRRTHWDAEFSARHGQTPGVSRPKFASIVLPRSKNATIIPFDVQPMVIEVPKKTISSGFAWGRR